MKFDKITLVSSDSIPFEVDICIAFQSDLIKTMCDDVNQAESVIPLPNVNSNVLAQVIEYCSTPAKLVLLLVD
jgi:S-phase kinase-associated protein 1